MCTIRFSYYYQYLLQRDSLRASEVYYAVAPFVSSPRCDKGIVFSTESEKEIQSVLLLDDVAFANDNAGVSIVCASKLDKSLKYP